MQALFYDPYLDSLGGGERYTLTLASFLTRRGHQVYMMWDNPDDLKKAAKKFKLDLSQIKTLPLHFLNQSLFTKISFMREFDLAFFVSDGSLPIMTSKTNVLHLQVPFHHVNGKKITNFLKKNTINHFVANSHFTKDVVDEEYGITSTVIFPPVDVENFTSDTKENIILYVARFSNLLQAKGHKEAIEAFKKLSDTKVHYKLWLAGSTEVGSEGLVEELRALAQDYPVEITTNPKFSHLKQLYARSRFFWSLAGIGLSEFDTPEKCEHFGMTTVEAMAAGCVPLAIRKGGFREIIQNETNGYLVDSLDELVTKTKKLIRSPKSVEDLSQAAQTRAQKFSTEKFEIAFAKLLRL